MFSGIVEDVVPVAEIREHPEGGRTLAFSNQELRERVTPGDSVSINGVCLTVEYSESSEISFHAVRETLSSTNLSELEEGDSVNVECSLKVGDDISGHMVMGHVDCVVEIPEIETHGKGKKFWFQLPREIRPFLARKGCVALDGVSLTPVDVKEDQFSVAIVPETLQRTNFGDKDTGDTVNVEVDVLARYVASQLDLSSDTQEQFTDDPTYQTN